MISPIPSSSELAFAKLRFLAAQFSLPAGPSWEDVQRLLAETEGDRLTDIRDHAILMLLAVYGLRSAELRGLQIEDLDWDKELIHITRPKQRKTQLYPLVPTVGESILRYLKEVRPRPSYREVFLNRCGRPLTRFGIHTMIERYAKKVSVRMPSLMTKRVSPHTIRHTTATHLLRAGVDINTIRAWLGHVSINTTNIYAEVDLEMKAKGLATCEVPSTKPAKRWREDAGLMAFLRTL